MNAVELKQQLLEYTMGWLPPSCHSLVSGMVFGEVEGFDDQLKGWLKVAGLQHVVSASGFNVSLILGLGWGVIELLLPGAPRKLKLFFGLSIIWGYIWLAGASPSLLRAGVMATLGLGARWFQRAAHPAWSLALTILILGSFDPSILSSLSFQLSVSATWGIMVAAPVLSSQAPSSWRQWQLGQVPLEEQRSGSLWQRAVAELTDTWWVTIAAQSFSWVLLWANFGEFSFVSFVANPALLWLTPPLTVGGVWLVLLSNLSRVLPVLSLSLPALAMAISLACTSFVTGLGWFGGWSSGLVRLPPFHWHWAVWWCVGWQTWLWWRADTKRRAVCAGRG